MVLEGHDRCLRDGPSQSLWIARFVAVPDECGGRLTRFAMGYNIGAGGMKGDPVNPTSLAPIVAPIEPQDGLRGPHARLGEHATMTKLLDHQPGHASSAPCDAVLPDDLEGVNALLRVFLHDTHRRFATNPHYQSLYAKLQQFVMGGGKRIRPRLCLSSYRIITSETDPPQPVWLTAASLELFHAFMLVHDDLIDGSVERRQRATLHEAVRLDSQAPNSASTTKKANDLGLLAGDLLLALGMRLMSHSGLEATVMSRTSQLLSDMLLETGLGQTLDVLYDDRSLEDLTEDQIVEAYCRKTSRYSISGPLVLGAIMGGAEEPVCRSLDRFGDLLGLGYQIENDLQALEQDPEHGDHSDLDTGKRTYLLWCAHQRLDISGREALRQSLASPVSPKRRRRLMDLIVTSGALNACRSRLDDIEREAISEIQHADLDEPRRLAYIALADVVRSRSRAVTQPQGANAPMHVRATH